MANFKFINADISKLSELNQIENFNPDIIFMNGAIHHLDDKLTEINLFISRFDKSMFFR